MNPAPDLGFLSQALTPRERLAAIARRLLPEWAARPLRRLIRKRRSAAATPFRAQAQEITLRHSADRPVILFAPSLDWRASLVQRPQHLARALAQAGALVFYFQPETTAREQAITPIEDRLYLCQMPLLAFDFLPRPYLYLLTWNRAYQSVFEHPQVIYDVLDDISLAAGDPRQVRRDHEALLRSARLVLTTASRLQQQAVAIRPDTLLCPNGVDFEHFAVARQPDDEPPADILPLLASARPLVGYYGALARWFDYDLLASLAQKRPDLDFVLIGPDFDHSLPEYLLALPNIHWLGPRSYVELPRYLQCFSVAIIPFQLNEITHATSPLKLFEYLAGGIPVIVTPMEESMRCPVALTAANADEFSRAIDLALQTRLDPGFRLLSEQTARENSWSARAEQILTALQS